MQDPLPLRGRHVALSISDTPDLENFGLSNKHLHDAAIELARYLIADGAHLIYGGDLRLGGYTEILAEVSARYHHETADRPFAFTNYIPWPASVDWSEADLQDRLDKLGQFALLVVLTPTGTETQPNARRKNPSAMDANWSESLTAMRRRINRESDSRIILGGATEGYKGMMPGVAEEALLCIQERKPLFLLGGFGGCARDMSYDFGLLKNSHKKRDWQGRSAFRGISVENLNNGLSLEENRRLADTPHIDEIVTLVLKGLYRLDESTPNR